MSSAYDTFDIDRLAVTPESIKRFEEKQAELRSAKAARFALIKKSKTRSRRSTRPMGDYVHYPLDRLFDTYNVSPSAGYVYAMCLHYWDMAFQTPTRVSLEDLRQSRRCNISRGTVRSAVHALEAAGLISVKRIPNAKMEISVIEVKESAAGDVA
jgi:hypothetical protein